MNPRHPPIALSLGLILSASAVFVSAAQPAPAPPPAPAARPPRPPAPARDPNTPGYVAAKELPDGTVPPADADGNFIIGPTHPKAPEMTPQDGVPRGTVHELTMKSTDSKIYPGIARDAGTLDRKSTRLNSSH